MSGYNKTPVSEQDLIDAGLHFGHQTKRWNPKMKRFIHGTKGGVYVIDLQKTLVQLKLAQEFLAGVIENGRKVLFVGTKKKARSILKEVAERAEQPYVIDRWLDGMLTNNQTVRMSVKRMEELQSIFADENKLKDSPKQELSVLRRELTKLERNLTGVKGLTSLPGALFVVDICREKLAIAEAQRLGIPVVALVDTNADPDVVEYPIPGNTDSVRSLSLIAKILGDTIVEAHNAYNKAKTATKSQIIAKISDEAGISKVQAKAVLDSLVTQAYKGAAAGFTVPGLGKLIKVRRKVCMGRNSTTGETSKTAKTTGKMLKSNEAVMKGKSAKVPAKLKKAKKAAKKVRPGLTAKGDKAHKKTAIKLEVPGQDDITVFKSMKFLEGACQGKQRITLAPSLTGSSKPRPLQKKVRKKSENPGWRITVWYGTDRTPIIKNGILCGYTGDREQAEKVHHGICDVFVPKSHEFGTVGSSFLKRLLKRSDDRLKINSIQATSEQQFWKDLQVALALIPEDDRVSVIFIHGYKVSFKEAAIRTAQIGVDLKVSGAMAFFSWASKGSLKKYAVDEATIESSESNIARFIEDFATKSSSKKVHIIAHSMGNRGLLRAVQRLVGKVEKRSRVQFGQIILAAADLDVQVFKDLAKHYPEVSERTTLYVSSKDHAVALSGAIHGYDRVGFTPPTTVVPGIDTVEVTNIDLSVLGHGYVGKAAPVLYDMADLMRNNAPPEERTRLFPEKNFEGLDYWVIRA